MRLNKKTSRIEINSVPENQSKIKFEVTFSGEWDWNKDFVRRAPSDTSLVDEYSFTSTDKFNQALINFIWGAVDGSRYFEKGSLSKIEVSKPVLDEFARYHSIRNDAKKLELAKQLAETEKKAAELRSKLGA